MKKLFLMTALVFSSTTILAADMEIIAVKRNITLADEDPVYKDFYIQTDSASGLKKSLVVKAVRRITVKDNGQKTVGEFKTTVGLLKIIHVEGKLAIAREFKLLPRDEAPMIEQIGIMSGDEIDLSESFTDTSKPAAKRKTASMAPAVESSPPATPATEKPVAPISPTSPLPLKSDAPTTST